MGRSRQRTSSVLGWAIALGELALGVVGNLIADQLPRAVARWFSAPTVFWITGTVAGVTLAAALWKPVGRWFHARGRRTWGPLPLRHEPFVRQREANDALRQLRRGRLVEVSGPPGSGKTQLAARVAMDLKGAKTVVWVQAVDEISLVAAIVGAFGKRSDPAADLEARGQAYEALARLQLKRVRAVIVLDGVQALSDVEWILGAAGTAKVLVTTNIRGLIPGAHHLHLDDLGTDAAIRMLEELSGQAGEEAAMVIGLIGTSPLAIANAAGQVEAEGITLRDYVVQYAARPAEVRLLPPGHDPSRSIEEAIGPSVSAIDRRLGEIAPSNAGLAKRVVELLAIFEPVGLQAQACADALGVELAAVQEVLELLCAYSLGVRLGPAGTTVHSIVAVATRSSRAAEPTVLAATRLLRAQHANASVTLAMKPVASLAAAVIRNCAGHTARGVLDAALHCCEDLIALGETQSAASLAAEVAGIHDLQWRDPESWSRAREYEADALVRVGRGAAAVEILFDVSNVRRAIAGAGPEDLARCDLLLVLAYESSGLHFEADRLLAQVEEALRASGSRSREVRAQLEWARARVSASDPDGADALPLFRNALQLLEDARGEGSPTLLTRRIEFAVWALSADRADIALDEARRCEDTWRRLGAESSRQSVYARHVRARALHKLGEPREAFALALRNTEVAEEILGPGHPLTISSLLLLGRIRMGRVDLAPSLQRLRLARFVLFYLGPRGFALAAAAYLRRRASSRT